MAANAFFAASRPAVVMEGLPFGMSNTAASPPNTAARVPEGMLSTAACSGSRRCVCASISPGSTCRPRASMTSAASAAAPGASVATTPRVSRLARTAKAGRRSPR